MTANSCRSPFVTGGPYESVFGHRRLRFLAAAKPSATAVTSAVRRARRSSNKICAQLVRASIRGILAFLMKGVSAGG